MKLINILFYLFIFVFLCVQVSAQNTNPVVTNVNHSNNSGTITITYDVADANQASVTISMFVSSDGGTTWDYACTQVSGNVGSGVTTGTGKTITWTHDNEHGGAPSGSNFIIKIIANDETAGGSPCAGTAKVYYEGGPNNDGGEDYYNTIQIADQCWLKENLDVGTRIDGNQNQTNIDPNYIEKYCYDDLNANCTTYGGLYQWNEAMKYVTNESAKGICPSGWHIPTLAEFEVLRDAVSGSSNAAKAVGQGTGDGAGTNTSGFSALVAGYRHRLQHFNMLTEDTYFWSSTEAASINAFQLYLKSSHNYFLLGFDDKFYGYSVRCLKD